ncbi:hypothetical protein EJB05_49590, partial [Eragrostis curvula]
MAAGAAKARAPNFVCSNPLQAADPATAFRAEEQDGPGRRSGEVRVDQRTDPGSRPPRHGSSSTASSEEHRRLLHDERLHGAAAPPRGAVRAPRRLPGQIRGLQAARRELPVSFYHITVIEHGRAQVCSSSVPFSCEQYILLA